MSLVKISLGVPEEPKRTLVGFGKLECDTKSLTSRHDRATNYIRESYKGGKDTGLTLCGEASPREYAERQAHGHPHDTL
jgi:hypothetical protein